jgi:hypothetical protein
MILMKIHFLLIFYKYTQDGTESYAEMSSLEPLKTVNIVIFILMKIEM